MKRILQIVGNMNCGGVENFIMNVFLKCKDNFIFDFIYLSPKDKYYFDDDIKKLNGKIYYLPKPNLFNIFSFIKDYRKIIKENSYEVVHSHVFYFSGLMAILSKIFGVKKFISHSHSTKDNKEELEKSFFRKIYMSISKKLIMKFSDEKLACGELAGKYLYGNNNFKIINNGIDCRKIINTNKNLIDNIKEKYNLKKEDIVIGHIGRFSKVKNHEFIIDLAKELIKNNKNIKFLLLGDGELKDNIQEKINKLNLSKNVFLVGNTSNVSEYLECMSCIILPSFYEGFPIVLIEAQMSGLPFIASDNISKEVDLKINSNKFLELDIEKWKKYILNNDFLRIDKKLCIKKLEKFDIQNVAKILEEIYES